MKDSGIREEFEKAFEEWIEGPELDEAPTPNEIALWSVRKFEKK